MQSTNSELPLVTSPPKPLEEPSGMEEASTMLQNFSQIPSLSKAWAFPASDGVHVTLQLSQRNLPNNSQRKIITSFLLNETVLEHGEPATQLPVELKDTLIFSPSPSGRYNFIARPNADRKASVLEIWSRSGVLQEIHVPSAFHGSVLNDGWFGVGVAWSPDEKLVAYVAETPSQKQTPEWGQRLQRPTIQGKKEKPDGAAPKGWHGKGEFEEDWGELNTDKKPPALFVLHVDSGEVLAVQGIPDDVTCGQTQWSPDGKSLVFVVWKHQAENFPDFPQRLGVVYCFNRPCALHAVAWPQPDHRGQAPPAVKLVSDSILSSFSPRFTPDGSTLLFLSQQAAVSSGVHNATPALMSLSWQACADMIAQHDATTTAAAPGVSSRIVVDVVWNPSSPQDFPGLYAGILPEQPFVGNAGRWLVTSTQWRSNVAIVAVDIETGAVQRLTPENGSSYILLACSSDWLLAYESHPGLPFRLFACHIAETQQDAPHTWSWSRIPMADVEKIPESIAPVLSQIQSTILQVMPSKQGGAHVPFEAVVLHSAENPGPRPTVITPHGGPHTCYSAQYFMPLSFFVAGGYNVVLINYRGSTGFGEGSIQSLPGSISVQDVSDCMDALHAAIDAGYVDADRVAVIGGSHGGFLTGHLLGQHSTAFKAGVVRNPVCNISLMVHLTDIPDWCFVETWGTEIGKKRASAAPTAEDMGRFFEMSPIAHVGKVKAPLLMMLGACDRRVPLDDGKRYLDALRKGQDAPKTKLIVFPEDAHALDKPQTEFEQWLTAFWWVQTHMEGR